MNKIKTIAARAPMTLICNFEDGSTKIIDLTSIKDLEVFKFLNNEMDFKTVTNKGYFIEWPLFEADLSADTLWNWDKPTA